MASVTGAKVSKINGNMATENFQFQSQEKTDAISKTILKFKIFFSNLANGNS